MKPNAKHKMDSRQIVPCLIVLSFFFVCFFGFFVFVLFVFFFILLGDRLIKRGVKSVSNQASRVKPRWPLFEFDVKIRQEISWKKMFGVCGWLDKKFATVYMFTADLREDLR